MKSPNIRYLPGVDQLRAYAALLIVFYHADMIYHVVPRHGLKDLRPFWFLPRQPFVVFLQEGHTAVALFMVLSGFVFSVGSIGREIEYGPFIKNRLLRIYPLFLVVLFVGIAAIPTGFSLAGFAQLLFQANFHGEFGLEPFTSMSWAVAVEFQFYLLFPFLHRILEREGNRWAFGFIVLMIALRYVAVIGGTSNAREISYWHLVGRIDQFLLGMLAARAYVRLHERELPWLLLTAVSCVAALTIMVLFSLAGGYDSVQTWKIVWPTIEGAMWAVFIVNYVALVQRHPSKWWYPIEQIGCWSFSLYLWHFALIYALPNVIPSVLGYVPQRFWAVYAWLVLLPVLLPLAALSYHVIERPFLRMRVRYLREEPTSAPLHVAATTPVRQATGS